MAFKVLLADDHSLLLDGIRGDTRAERETAILRAVARGLSNNAIGKELWVSEQTVKLHLTNICPKLEVANRTKAACHAYRHGLIDAPAGRMT